MTSFAGKVVAIVGPGGERVRAVAVAFAEGGADLALGTQSRAQEHEFAMASIANEIWVIGNEQFLRVMESSDTAEVEGFADETWGELQGCDVLVAFVPDPSALVRVFAPRMASGGVIVLVAAGDEESGALAAQATILSSLAPGIRLETVTMALPGEQAAVLAAAAPH